jgi:hypothetical protein
MAARLSSKFKHELLKARRNRGHRIGCSLNCAKGEWVTNASITRPFSGVAKPDEIASADHVRFGYRVPSMQSMLYIIAIDLIAELTSSSALYEVGLRYLSTVY